MKGEVLQGDCLAVIRGFAPGSFHCCVTSPPYWGLRDYGVPKTVWGGEMECEHEWGDTLAVNATNHTDKRRWNHTRNGRDEEQSMEKRVAWLRTVVDQGNFCQKCGAWRGAFGLEPTPELYVEHSVTFFRDVWRVLRDDGVLFLNLGDSYATGAGKVGDCPGGGEQGERWAGARGANPTTSKRGTNIGPMTQPNRMSIPGLKPKDLCGIPWRVALALQADGWWLRSDVIWAKPNPMPESVTDRPTRSHEYIFVLTKSARYYWDAEAVKEANAPDYAKPHPIIRRSDAKTDDARNDADTFHGNGGDAGKYSGYGRNLRSVWTITTKPNSDSWPDFDAADYVGGDGKPYIASPDCPVHGRLAGRRTQQMASGDAQLDLPALRNLGIDAHRAARRVPSPDANALTTSDKTDAGTSLRRSAESMEPNRTQAGQSLPEDGQGGSGETPCHTNRSAGSATLGAGSSGSPQPDSVAPATENSSENRRTGRAQLTTSPCSVSDGTSDRIGGTSGQLCLAGAADRTSESSSGQADLGGHPSAGTQSRSVHKSSCHNSTCKCTISQVAHFATFPPDIPERCIKAATSERGVCPKCGKQWERVVEMGERKPHPACWSAKSPHQFDADANEYATSATLKTVRESRTTGWRPGCECGLEAVPAQVLDPFGGAGTVGMVAAKLGRSSTSIELNPAYVAIARKRIEAATRQGKLSL